MSTSLVAWRQLRILIGINSKHVTGGGGRHGVINSSCNGVTKLNEIMARHQRNKQMASASL